MRGACGCPGILTIVRSPSRKEWCNRANARLKTMVLFYISIPIMVLALAVAVMPLVWAMVHQYRRNEFEPIVARVSHGAWPDREAA